MKDIDERHERILEQQEDLPPETGTRAAGMDKADRMDAERDDEQEEGITRARRGSRAAPSDRPENEPPHPQDVNEIGETRG
ncbi:MAG TPA: hypothetical protein VI814_02050 [Candidatus Limnocylindria bacterium]